MSPNMAPWRKSLEAFFEERGAAVSGRPTLDELCFIAGRDPRVWRDDATRAGIAEDITKLTDIGPSTHVLEVGCAAGFLAMLVAPSAARYTGVDVAEAPLKVARRLGLRNARFERADGAALPFPNSAFDGAFCCDVFINLPSIEDGVALVGEMLRVVKPGRPVLVGNVPDRARAADLPRRVAEVASAMEARYGSAPLPPSKSREGVLQRVRGYFGGVLSASEIPPMVVTYDFDRSDFERLADRLGATAAICEINKLHPYHGFRFHAVYRTLSQ